MDFFLNEKLGTVKWTIFNKFQPITRGVLQKESVINIPLILFLGEKNIWKLLSERMSWRNIILV